MPEHTSNDTLNVTIDGQRVSVPAGTTVAAAVLNHGRYTFHSSVNGESRAPLCGMGICFECRLTVDGMSGERSCTLICRDGMAIQTAQESGQ